MDEPLDIFASAYGRMCVLVSLALAQRHPQDRVMRASRGMGNDVAPVYVNLRTQRRRVNLALERCHNENVDRAQILLRAQTARSAIGQEFMCRIPIMG